MMNHVASNLCSIVSRSCAGAAYDVVSLTTGWTVHDYGLEAFLVYKTAFDIRKKFRFYGKTVSVFPELAAEVIWEDAGTSGVGKPPKALQGRPRIDLVVYASQGAKPLAAIEFKRFVNYSQFKTDIGRISTLLRKMGGPADGPMRFGVVAGVRPVHDSQRKTSDDAVSEILSKASKDFADFSFDYRRSRRNLKEPLPLDDGGAITGFDGVAIVLVPKK